MSALLSLLLLLLYFSSFVYVVHTKTHTYSHTSRRDEEFYRSFEDFPVLCVSGLSMRYLRNQKLSILQLLNDNNNLRCKFTVTANSIAGGQHFVAGISTLLDSIRRIPSIEVPQLTFPKSFANITPSLQAATPSSEENDSRYGFPDIKKKDFHLQHDVHFCTQFFVSKLTASNCFFCFLFLSLLLHIYLFLCFLSFQFPHTSMDILSFCSGVFLCHLSLSFFFFLAACTVVNTASRGTLDGLNSFFKKKDFDTDNVTTELSYIDAEEHRIFLKTIYGLLHTNAGYQVDSDSINIAMKAIATSFSTGKRLACPQTLAVTLAPRSTNLAKKTIAIEDERIPHFTNCFSVDTYTSQLLNRSKYEDCQEYANTILPFLDKVRDIAPTFSFFLLFFRLYVPVCVFVCLCVCIRKENQI